MKILVFAHQEELDAYKNGIARIPKAEHKLNPPSVSEHGDDVKGWPRVAIEHWFMGDVELHFIKRSEALAALTKLNV